MNLKWYNRAYIYFNLCPSARNFCKEFNFLRYEVGILKRYKFKEKTL